jgi:hypothetical protein
MMLRRLVAMFLVFGMVCGLSLPTVLGQDKDKGKDSKGTDKGGEKVTLKWKFEKDKVFYQKMVTKTSQTMKVMNNDVQQTQNQIFYFSFKPTKIEGDKVTLEQKIIGVAMDIEIGGSKIQYDSTKDTTASNPLGDFFKALVDATFTIELDTKALTVAKIDGRDNFIAKLVAANPQMKPLLEVILSAQALKEMAEPTFAVIPTKEVTKGDKWSRPKTTLDMGPIGKYENEYGFTYEGSEGTGDKLMHRIKLETKLTYKEPSEAGGQGGLPFKIKSAKLASKPESGQVLFSAAKGRVEKFSQKLQLEGDLTIEIGGQSTTVKLSQTQESTIDTMDDNPIPKKK